MIKVILTVVSSSVAIFDIESQSLSTGPIIRINASSADNTVGNNNALSLNVGSGFPIGDK